MTLERLAPVEVRLAGRTLTGVAMRYGEQARDRAEMFEAGAFQPLGVVSLNLQHDPERVIASTDGGSLRITDTPTQLRVDADLREGSAELSLARRRTLRGLSVEFRAITERRDPSGLRIVERAELPAIGLVDEGSYHTEIEVRAWLSATVPYRTKMDCECQGPDCDSVYFEEGSFDLGGDGDELLAINGPATRVIGSRKRGTLVVDETDDGLDVQLTGQRTGLVEEVQEQAATAPMFVRPILDESDVVYTDSGRTRRYSRARVKALLVKATSTDRGHLEANVDTPEKRRRRVWL